MLNDTDPVHIHIGAPQGDYFGRGTGYITVAGQAREDAKRAISNRASVVTVRTLVTPCQAYRWVPSSDILGIMGGWRTIHLAGHCRNTCK